MSLISFLFTQYGKNIVQYDLFNWEFIQTKNFDIYFYSEGEIQLDIIAKYCEDALLNTLITEQVTNKAKDALEMMLARKAKGKIALTTSFYKS